ncbi:MAG: pyruvate kinase [Clostridium sp.]|nr:pyruvate kinase [Clostridium sp.]
MDIICSIGPKIHTLNHIKDYYEAGMTMARFNFSHVDYEKFGYLIEGIKNNYSNVSIIQDLQGNKIRVSKSFGKEKKIYKGEKAIFCLENRFQSLLDNPKLNYKIIPIFYEGNLADFKYVKYIFMKDATMRFQVIKKTNNYILTLTESGGIIRGEKGINAPGLIRSDLKLTNKDKEDIKFGIEKGVDVICLSYVTSSNNMVELKKYLQSLNTNTDNIKLWAKIECKEAILNFNNILEECDGIMLGRGDLKGEVPISKIPSIENKIISKMKRDSKPLIIGTYVLDSMSKSEIPSIAEVNDIYRYFLNKVDGLMLSTELTVSNNPIRIVKSLCNLLKKF